MISFLALSLWASPVLAQEGGAEPDAADQPAAAPTPEQQAKATELFNEGKKLAAEKKLVEAIAKFEEAYATYADIALRYVIGEAYQLLGNETSEFDHFRKAVENYKQYVEKVPEGQLTDIANTRIGQLEEAIAAEEQRIADEKAQEEKDRLAAEDELRKAEEAKKQQLLERDKMQVALDAKVLVGADLDLSANLRMMGGGMLTWEHFALEGSIGLDGTLRIDNDKGLTTRSFTLLDLGARYGANHHFIGPFVSAGAGFAVVTGKPRNRKLSGDTETCADFDDNICSFDIDKTITTRLAFGYGFSASKKTTVALRLETQLMFLSVDGDQGVGSVPAYDVAKPQTAMAFLLGIEFMRWM